MRWPREFSPPSTDRVFIDEAERGFAVKIQEVWSWWDEGLITTHERIVALKEIEWFETSRIQGRRKKEILRASVQQSYFFRNRVP